MSIGKKIEEVRKRKNMSQRDLATILEMNPSQYSKIERDLVDPRFSTIEKICSGLKISVSDFFLTYKASKNHNSPLLEKVMLIEKLSPKDQSTIFSLVDSLLDKNVKS